MNTNRNLKPAFLSVIVIILFLVIIIAAAVLAVFFLKDNSTVSKSLDKRESHIQTQEIDSWPK